MNRCENQYHISQASFVHFIGWTEQGLLLLSLPVKVAVSREKLLCRIKKLERFKMSLAGLKINVIMLLPCKSYVGFKIVSVLCDSESFVS